MNQEQRAASVIAAGILTASRDIGKDLKKQIMFYTGVVIFLNFAFLAISTDGFAKDDTDGTERSNMKLHTDNRTGCQYLSAINGGITPRVDGRGNHIGCRDNN